MTSTTKCGFPGCRYMVRQADIGWVHLYTDGLPTGHTPRPADHRADLIANLARQMRDIGTAYTRAFGREDNAARVLELTVADAHSLGDRILAVIETGADPGDPRYRCGTRFCTLAKGHSAAHHLDSQP